VKVLSSSPSNKKTKNKNQTKDFLEHPYYIYLVAADFRREVETVVILAWPENLRLCLMGNRRLRTFSLEERRPRSDRSSVQISAGASKCKWNRLALGIP
jgi:hypothetical protein